MPLAQMVGARWWIGESLVMNKVKLLWKDFTTMPNPVKDKEGSRRSMAQKLQHTGCDLKLQCVVPWGFAAGRTDGSNWRVDPSASATHYMFPGAFLASHDMFPGILVSGGQFQSRETFFAEEADICLIWDAGSDREYICHFPTIQLVETVSVFCQSWFSGNARLLLYAGRQIPFLWEHGRLILLLSKLSSSSPLNNQDSWSLWSQEENQKIHVRSPGRFLRPLFFLKALNWTSSSSHSFWKVSFRKCNWQLTD